MSNRAVWITAYFVILISAVVLTIKLCQHEDRLQMLEPPASASAGPTASSSAAACPSCPPCPSAEVVLAELVLEDAAPPECEPLPSRAEKSNRDACIEVGDAPEGTDDPTLRVVGARADHLLREHWPYITHGVGTRAKDNERVIRYWNVDRRDAERACRYLDCKGWSGPDIGYAEVNRYCKVLVGKACHY